VLPRQQERCVEDIKIWQKIFKRSWQTRKSWIDSMENLTPHCSICFSSFELMFNLDQMVEGLKTACIFFFEVL
jgi:hypothetical protein